jgi:hypothetical protein
VCALATGIVIPGYSVKKIVRRLVGSYKWLFGEVGCICEENRVNYWSLKQRQMKATFIGSTGKSSGQAVQQCSTLQRTVQKLCELVCDIKFADTYQCLEHVTA